MSELLFFDVYVYKKPESIKSSTLHQQPMSPIREVLRRFGLFKEQGFSRVIITREVINSILDLGRDTYPREVMMFLGGRANSGVLRIDRLLFQPYEASPESAYARINFPLLTKPMGSFHSHPRGINRPSDADLRLFSKYPGVHLIISYPFRMQDIAAYDHNGERLGFEVAEK
ncbi:hypothetical protein COT48_04940 [Candidatus Woesearchaeota archaeon CG08_land_8_20_14_0_20_47_9]|nr:MAG: hypothetical protein COV22_04640 [Candidatus Woesearchaeota archaeon CG10_big_fil_rev_8_21_14_0_10_47_5]PIO03418.1 MAG: hypothetical protein COT48_04940 [Candidatus Woesearchaeota archaeon CG08_land_8_20_14_0_20_47_9]